MKILLNALRKWFLLILLAALFFAFFYFDLEDYLTFETLKNYQSIAYRWTSQHYFSAVTLYIGVFTLLIACAIPCATFLTLVGGFLFGIIAVVYAMLGTTLGGIILFFAVRIAVGRGIAARRKGLIKRMERGFQQNAFNYLLLLRLVPIFPCWISNISAGALNVPFKTFVAATVLGILPATFIYAMVGRGFDKFFAESNQMNLYILLDPSIFFPLVALGFISLFPFIYKRLRRNKKNNLN